MVKTRSQQKIAFPRRKSKSRSKSDIKSSDSDSTKSCCMATLSRVCREKTKDVDCIDRRGSFDVSPAKRRKANSEALPLRSVKFNLEEKENDMETTRRCLSYSEGQDENQVQVVIPRKSHSRLQAKADSEHKRLTKSPMVPSAHVEVSSPKIFIDNCASSTDGTPLKCASRRVQADMKRSSSRSSVNSTQSEKRRHSSSSDKERLSSAKKQQLPPKRQSNSSGNATPNRQFLHIGLQDGQLYKDAKHVLHSSIPNTLLCRETEIKQINTFLKNHVVDKQPGSLYISGAPGTGKTACLTLILEQLKKNGLDYQVQFINCMNMSRSHRIYSKITEELTGWDKLTNKEAEKFLEKKFTTKGSPIVLVLDEIDQLESKNQDVLYTMFEWPSLPSSRLILIGIANALDLTDRVLPRLQLRTECKPKLLHFSPYSKDQIVKILSARLSEVEGTNVLDVSAVQFCARKIAAVSGDMRKALDICRRAVEVVESEVKRQQILKPIEMTPSPKKAAMKKVTIAHVSKVISEVYGSRIIKSTSGEQPTIPLQQKLLICTILLMQKESKLREIPVGQLHETYCSICKKRQVSQISQEDCLALCSLLETRGIISMKRAKETRMAKVSLKIDEKEVDYALQDKILLSSILQAGLAKG